MFSSRVKPVVSCWEVLQQCAEVLTIADIQWLLCTCPWVISRLSRRQEMFGVEHPTNKFNKSHLLDTNWHDLENMSSQNLCSASPTILNPVAKKYWEMPAVELGFWGRPVVCQNWRPNSKSFVIGRVEPPNFWYPKTHFLWDSLRAIPSTKDFWL
jgi:hypothetical protein